MRVRVDGTVYNLDDEINLDRYKIHTIEAVVDRLVICSMPKMTEEQQASALAPDRFGRNGAQGRGGLPDRPESVRGTRPQDLLFSEHLACPEHGVSLPEIEPRTFSFNTPHGACPDCQGLGSKLEIDPDLIIPDTERSLNEGAIVAHGVEWPARTGRLLLADARSGGAALSHRPGYAGQ